MSLYTHDTDLLMEASIGADGLTEAVLTPLFAQLEGGLDTLRQWRDARKLPILCLPGEDGDLAEIEAVAQRFRQFAHVFIVGTGGSSLGGQTLAALKENIFATGKPGAPRVWFMDNVDPVTMDAALSAVDMREAGFIVISKSGGTAEIVAQMLVLLDAVAAQAGEDAPARQFLAITEPTPNPLRRLSEQYGIPVLDHDPKVGGRFSVLSPVGLIPAAIAGLDVRKVRRGAAEVLDAALDARTHPAGNVVATGAAVHYALMKKGCSVSVLMPYCDRLAYFGMWFRQLWAESLGKDGQGSTPVRALGTVDQHSQLQLYLDGPRDKFFTLLLVDAAGKGPEIHAARITDDRLAYLRDKHIGDVMNAHQCATTRTLGNSKRPVRLMRVAELDEAVLGGLLMHFMLETILTAHLMKINAYDQPAVEESKTLAREYLSAA